MNSKIRKGTGFVLVGIAVLCMAGCLFSRVEPIEQFPDAKYSLFTKTTLANYMEEAFRRVREREPSTEWSVVSVSEDAVRVQCSWRMNSFEVDVVLKDDSYNVRYVSSSNLSATDDGRIYYGYNKLVKYLMEELFDINHRRYTDPLHKETRFTLWGGDYVRERISVNESEMMRTMNNQGMRAKEAEKAVLVSGEKGGQCPDCKAQTKPGDRFCPQCGKAFANVCRKCGKPVSGKFCGACGAPVQE